MVTDLPPVESPEWRRIYPVPHDVRFDAGGFCPHDDSELFNDRDGLVCPRCAACWDLRGRHGRWLLSAHDAAPAGSTQLRRLDRRLATTVGVTAGGALAFTAGRTFTSAADDVPVELVWTVVVLLVVAAGVVGAVAAWRWLIDWARYGDNEVLGTCAELGLSDKPAVAAAQLAVRDGQ